MALVPLQIGIQVRDVAEARRLYREVLGCLDGRGGGQGFDLNLCGNQIVCRLNPQLGKRGRVVSHYHLVDGKYVRGSDFGVELELREWRSLEQILSLHGVKFVIEPRFNFDSTPAPQATLFFQDPSGNALETLSFCDIAKEPSTTFSGWVRWATLTAFIACCILLLFRKPASEIAAEDFTAGAYPPPCVTARSCMP
jgi:hypothetical protein